MKILPSNFRHWAQEKIKSLNAQHATHLATQFSYICRAEYLNGCAINSNMQGISNEKYCGNEIIVSLTTHGRRLHETYLAIESIMQQTLKPNRIILWLSDDFKNIDIPRVLQRQQKRGLEIRFCKDIRSYTKLIPALMNFPSSTIITIDDDQLYHFDLLENLVNAHKNHPKMIFCGRMHRMRLLAKDKLEKYSKWTLGYEDFDISPLNFPVGVGGVLYPPNCFNEEIFNENIFLEICKYADDIWFKAMALLNGVRSQKVFTHNKNGKDHLRIENSQYTALSYINRSQGMNDVQLKMVFDKYNLYEKLFDN